MRSSTRTGLIFAALLTLALVSRPARADPEASGKRGHGEGGHGGEGGQGGRHHAPEPLTLAGFAVGAGALAWARRRSLRNRR